MEELELPFWGLPAGFLALLIIAWIGLGILWNKRYRPNSLKKGKPTPTFNNALGRVLKFLFKEDVKAGKLGKLLSWRNIYVIHLLAIFALLFLDQVLFAGLVFLSLFVLAFGRVKKVFALRNRLLTRMFEVAHSEFKYPRGHELNPWSSVRVHKWSGDDLATPEKITVSFPPAFRSDDPRKRQDFEKHFDGTVAKDNIWTYSWDGAEGVVECEPVPHLPTMVDYPGSLHRPWDEIPLGQGIDGEIVWKVTDNPHILVCGTTGGGKSVLQRNIVFHCIQHSDKWQFLGIDPKRVELSAYAKYDNAVLGIATNLEDGVEVMRFANEQMMDRYEAMEEMGVSNFLDMPDPPPALMVMIDEAYIFMATTGGKTDVQKEQDELHGEATVLVGDVARLGRAAGVHLVVATQRPDAKVIYGEIKANLPVRYMAGRSGSTPSLMVLETDTGTRVPGNIKGRGVISTNGDEEFIQGYFAPSSWIDEWLNSHDTDSEDSQLSKQMPDSLKSSLVTSDSQVLPDKKNRKKGKVEEPTESDFGQDTGQEEPAEDLSEAHEDSSEDLLAPSEMAAQLEDLEDEEDDALFSAPSPAPPAGVEEDEDEDALVLNPQRIPRPTLKGNQVEEENTEVLWDDEMDNLVGDRNAPQPARQPKTSTPSRPAPTPQKPVESPPTPSQEPVRARPAAEDAPKVAAPPASPLASPPSPPSPKVARPPSTGASRKESNISLPALPPLPPRPKQE